MGMVRNMMAANTNKLGPVNLSGLHISHYEGTPTDRLARCPRFAPVLWALTWAKANLGGVTRQHRRPRLNLYLYPQSLSIYESQDLTLHTMLSGAAIVGQTLAEGFER
jgi:hypothetical protein